MLGGYFSHPLVRRGGENRRLPGAAGKEIAAGERQRLQVLEPSQRQRVAGFRLTARVFERQYALFVEARLDKGSRTNTILTAYLYGRLGSAETLAAREIERDRAARYTRGRIVDIHRLKSGYRGTRAVIANLSGPDRRGPFQYLDGPSVDRSGTIRHRQRCRQVGQVRAGGQGRSAQGCLQ